MRELEPITVVLVAFNVQQENSVYYKKIPNASFAKIAKALEKAWFKEADFVSVRFIR